MSTPKMVQWWKNGDHPKDNSVEIPLEERTAQHVSFLTPGAVVGFLDTPGLQPHDICGECSSPWRIHGVVDAAHGEETAPHVVHPGDWISVNKIKGAYTVTHPDPMAQAQATLEAAGALKVDDE